MLKNKLRVVNILSIVLMVVNIFLALPNIVLNIYRRKESTFIIALFFFVIGFYFMPDNDGYDIARYLELFDNEVLREGLFGYQRDVYAEYLTKMLLYFKLNRHFLPAISSFITYYFLFKSLKKVLQEYKIKNEIYLLLYLITYFTIEIIGFTGIRFLPALTINCYGILLYCEYREKKGIFYIILSILIHNSFLLSLAILFLTNFTVKILNRNILKIIAIVIILISVFFIEDILLSLIHYINSFEVIFISPTYVIGKWGSSYGEDWGIVGRSFRIYLRYFFMLSIGTIFIVMQLKRKKLDYYICYFSIVSLSLLKLHTFSQRYFCIVLLLIYFLMLKRYFITRKKDIIVLIFTLILLKSGYDVLRDFRDYLPALILTFSKFYKFSIFDIFLNIMD